MLISFLVAMEEKNLTVPFQNVYILHFSMNYMVLASKCLKPDGASPGFLLSPHTL